MKTRICGVLVALIVPLLPLSASARQHQHQGKATTTTTTEAREGMHSGMMNMGHAGMMSGMDHSGMEGAMDHSGMTSGVVKRSTMDVFFLPAVAGRLDLSDTQARRMVELADEIAALVAEGPGELATLGDDPSTADVREYFVRQADLRAHIFDIARTMLNVLTPAQQTGYAAIEMKELHEAVMGSSRHMTMMALMSQLGCGSMSMEAMPMMPSEPDSTKGGMHGRMSHEKQDQR